MASGNINEDAALLHRIRRGGRSVPSVPSRRWTESSTLEAKALSKQLSICRRPAGDNMKVEEEEDSKKQRQAFMAVFHAQLVESPKKPVVPTTKCTISSSEPPA